MAVLRHGAAAHEAQVSRRWFLRAAWGAGLLLFLVEAAGAFADFFRPRKIGAFGTEMSVGTVDQFPVGSVTRITAGRFYLSHVPEGFLALYQKCPHLGCTVPWQPSEPSEDKIAPQGRFHCPCHGSIYDRYGQIISGPAPRPMDIMKIRIEGGKVFVNTGEIAQREIWKPEQAVKA